MVTNGRDPRAAGCRADAGLGAGTGCGAGCGAGFGWTTRGVDGRATGSRVARGTLLGAAEALAGVGCGFAGVSGSFSVVRRARLRFCGGFGAGDAAGRGTEIENTCGCGLALEMGTVVIFTRGENGLAGFFGAGAPSPPAGCCGSGEAGLLGSEDKSQISNFKFATSHSSGLPTSRHVPHVARSFMSMNSPITATAMLPLHMVQRPMLSGLA